MKKTNRRFLNSRKTNLKLKILRNRPEAIKRIQIIAECIRQIDEDVINRIQLSPDNTQQILNSIVDGTYQNKYTALFKLYSNGK